MGTKILLTVVRVTVLSGAATGSSAANPALLPTAQNRIVGMVCAGLATTTGWGLIHGCVLNADGSITVTTNANVAAANLLVDVTVATVANAA